MQYDYMQLNNLSHTKKLLLNLVGPAHDLRDLQRHKADNLGHMCV